VYFRLSALVTLPKNCWPKVLGSVVIQLYVGECTPSVDRALAVDCSLFDKCPLIYQIFSMSLGVIGNQ